MEIKTNMLSLEEELTNVEINSFQEEKEYAEKNYSALDDQLFDAKKSLPYPDITMYARAIDYEDQEDLQIKKRMNRRFEDKIRLLEAYVKDGSLYCGHFKTGINDVYLMDHSQHQSRHFKRKDGTEFFLLNVNDKLYQDFVNKWRFPSDYDDVELSRNVVLNDRIVTDVDVIFENTNSAFSDITDSYLRKALLRNKNKSSTQSIIQTIQKKQDYIRTYDKDASFVVQGCAGSGKTMVLLHRLRYLLFNDELHNDEYVLLIPSMGFRTFIDGLSKKFNISRSNIVSYQEYYASLSGNSINEEDVKDELVFDGDYLYEVYSDGFMRLCYRSFFENIIRQTEDLIAYCDKKLEYEMNAENDILFEKLVNTDDEILNEINNVLSPICTYIGIGKLESIDEALCVLDALRYDHEKLLKQAYTDIKDADPDEDQIERLIQNNSNLLALKNQIENERALYEKSSMFTKSSHKRKLEQLEQNYENQKEILIRSYEESDNKKKNIAIRINGCINRIITNRLKKTIDQLSHLLERRNEKTLFLENVLNDFEETFASVFSEPIELLNELIEISACISDFELKYIEPMLPSREVLLEIINKGTEVANSFIENGLFAKTDLSKQTKMFAKRTPMQTIAYLHALLFSSIKSKIYQKYKIKLCKLYKHYWYLQLYSKYLVGEVVNKKKKYIFIDEAQDLSLNEIELINKINADHSDGFINNPVLNLFGDVNQTITKHGISNWKELKLQFGIFELNENFRNTNQIIEYCNSNLPFDMRKIGVDMDDVVVYSDLSEALNGNLRISEAVIIVKNEFVKEDLVALLDEMNKEHTIITVKEAKGLEFKEVIVIDCQMNDNEKYVAYTRALVKLSIIKSIPIKTLHRNLIVDGDDESINIENEGEDDTEIENQSN